MKVIDSNSSEPISTPRKRINPAALLEKANKEGSSIREGFLNPSSEVSNEDMQDIPVVDPEQVRPRPERPQPVANNNNQDIINLKKEIQELKEFIILPELRKQYLNRAYKEGNDLFIILKISSPTRIQVQKISDREYINLNLKINSFDDLDFRVSGKEIDLIVENLKKNIDDSILCIK